MGGLCLGFSLWALSITLGWTAGWPLLPPSPRDDPAWLRLEADARAEAPADVAALEDASATPEDAAARLRAWHARPPPSAPASGPACRAPAKPLALHALVRSALQERPLQAGTVRAAAALVAHLRRRADRPLGLATALGLEGVILGSGRLREGEEARGRPADDRRAVAVGLVCMVQAADAVTPGGRSEVAYRLALQVDAATRGLAGEALAAALDAATQDARALGVAVLAVTWPGELADQIRRAQRTRARWPP